MLVIRLLRGGKRNQPIFKIIVVDKRRSAKVGRFVEELGNWNPLTKEKILKKERIKYWLSVGAQPSDTIYNMLVSEKIIEGKKIPLHKKSKKKEATSEATSAAPAAPAAAAAVEKPAETSPEEKKEEKKTPEAETKTE